MVGLQVPNSRLKAFDTEIQDGKILLMLDVPSSALRGNPRRHRAHASRRRPIAATSPPSPRFRRTDEAGVGTIIESAIIVS